jgi:hypothetical protein
MWNGLGIHLQVKRGAEPPVIPWYLAGGISAANCVAAYQPKGAASLAASYINLANPGTNNAVPGVAPSLSANGWVFTGTQYLKALTPTNATSVIVRFVNVTAVQNAVLFGYYNSNRHFELFPNRPDFNEIGWAYGNSGGKNINGGLSQGVAALTGGDQGHGYVNGVESQWSIGDWTGVADDVLYIGARNWALEGDIDRYLRGTICAYAQYNTVLTAPKVAALTTAMAAL